MALSYFMYGSTRNKTSFSPLLKPIETFLLYFEVGFVKESSLLHCILALAAEKSDGFQGRSSGL